MSAASTTDIDGAKQPDDRLRDSRSDPRALRMNIENRQGFRGLRASFDRRRVVVEDALGRQDEKRSRFQTWVRH